MIWINYLNTLLQEYPIEFFIGILGIFYSMFRKINDLLPSRLRMDKKYYFWRQVENTICTISLSIIMKKNINKKDIKLIYLKNYLNKSIKIINEDPLTLQSLKTGMVYSFNLGENDNENFTTVFIESSQGFRTGKFGEIINLEKNIDELQTILNYFTLDKQNIEKVNTKIKISPRKNELREIKKVITSSNREYSISYNEKQIEIVTQGLPIVKELIKKSLNIWMQNFIE